MSLGINNPFILKERERPEIEEKDQSAYQKFFAKELSKRGVKSPSELAPRIKKHSLIILIRIGKVTMNPTNGFSHRQFNGKAIYKGRCS